MQFRVKVMGLTASFASCKARRGLLLQTQRLGCNFTTLAGWVSSLSLGQVLRPGKNLHVCEIEGDNIKGRRDAG